MKHSELLEKIAILTGKTPKQKDIADILGKQVNTISSRASKNLNYDYEELKQIGNHYGINLLDNRLENIKKDILTKRMDYLEQKYDFIADYYPDIFGSCGTGTFILSETTEKIQVPKELVKGYSKVKKYSVINAYGDSMMPYIQDKDMLIVEHQDGEQIKDNRIYVFCYNDCIFVKRLVLNINQLIIKSDNTEYKPIALEKNEIDDVHIIGQIVGLMRSTM